MSKLIEYIDCVSKSTDEISKLISKSDYPFILCNGINDWPASKWSLDQFTKLFGDIMTKFKLHERDTCASKKAKLDENVDPVIMETDCYFINATFKQFMFWLHPNSGNDYDVGELKKYPCDKFWCYADYKYMAEIFPKDQLTAVDWSVFGFPNRHGYHSTIWIGSAGAFTPCHQDTYGTNLVAQIHGIKKWILVPPGEKLLMKATRIPYEESSVFSKANIESLDKTKCVGVELKPGEVLFVPKHWWHYVESITPSISINTWLEHSDDPHDRVRESIVNFLVYAVKKSGDDPVSNWLNPTQELSSSLGACQELVNSALQDYSVDDESVLSEQTIDDNFLLNCVTDPEVLDKIISVMVQKISLNENK